MWGWGWGWGVCVLEGCRAEGTATVLAGSQGLTKPTGCPELYSLLGLSHAHEKRELPLGSCALPLNKASVCLCPGVAGQSSMLTIQPSNPLPPRSLAL